MPTANLHAIEFATIGFATPGLAVPVAEAAERDGFDILLLTDSQCLRGDVYTQLVLCGKATSKLKLGTGVTNPLTRHASVTAASIMSVQAETNGRAILGIGRGDSSVLHIGRKPASLHDYESYVRAVQGYIRGDVVNENGFPSQLHWLRGVPQVPIDMVGSGPKSLELAGRLADRVTLAVGADPERIAWGVARVHQGAKQAGRSPDGTRIGAYINIGISDDKAGAREAIKGSVAAFAHFSASSGADFENQPEIMLRVTKPLMTEYDTRHHTESAALHTNYLDDAFIDWFAIVGTSTTAVDRLASLVRMGLSHFYFVGVGRDQLTKDVMPTLRQLQVNRRVGLSESAD
jgi:5,10-methylenetetrahydromethanopterin reductase